MGIVLLSLGLSAVENMDCQLVMAKVDLQVAQMNFAIVSGNSKYFDDSLKYAYKHLKTAPKVCKREYEINNINGEYVVQAKKLKDWEK